MSDVSVSSPPPSAPRLMRLPEVIRKTGKARSTIYAEMKAGTFPKPISLGKRAVAWQESIIDDWIANLIQTSQDIAPDARLQA